MTAPSIEVGQLIAHLRQRRGWSQEALLEHLGQHRHKNMISKWERGHGVGVGALLELVGVMPELGDHLIALIRRAQQR
jgi:transcriptional regulator with XRE-family HTH domain